MTQVFLAPGPFGAGGQFFGLGGLPLTAGTISTYAAGGTTPLATYTSSAGSVQNANPIVLGPDGRPPNEIWVTSAAYRFDLKDALGNLIKTYDNLGGFVDSASLAASTGSSLVGFSQSGAGAVATDLEVKNRQTVSVFDFMTAAQIADVQSGAPVIDLSTVLATARAFLAANNYRYRLIFPSGKYSYSVSPNWAIQDATIEAAGEVRLLYTGVGNCVIFDAGVSVSNIFNTRFLGNFIVMGTTSALNGYFVRAVHHAMIEGRVDGCGTGSSGLLVNYAVATEFKVRTSVNETGLGTFYAGAKPLNGIYITRRAAGELTTNCIFHNPIVEGVGGDGIYIDYGSHNLFLSGTSESNTGLGISQTANSVINIFDGIDLETNTGGSLQDAGSGNYYLNTNATQTVTITAAAQYTRISGGRYDAIVDNGTGTSLSDFDYSVSGGAITGTGILRSSKNAHNLIGSVDATKTADSYITPVTSVLTATATTVITLSATGIVGNRLFHVFAYSAGNGANFVAYAVIYRDGANAYIVNQTNGANLSITLSGLNIQVTQTSGITLSVFAAAKAI